MEPEIENLHKIVYRAMESQFLNFDILQCLDNIMAYSTVASSIITLVNSELKNYLLEFGFELLKIDFSFFLINCFTVFTALCWLILTNKYNKTLIGQTAEKFKDIQYNINCSKNYDEAFNHFKEYLTIKPKINDLFVTWKWLINKKLEKSGKTSYKF